MQKFNFCVADLETTIIPNLDEFYISEEQRFIIGACCIDSQVYFFDDINELINILIGTKTKVCYFHNLDYDYRFIQEQLSNYTKEYIIRGSQLLRVRCYKNDKFVFEFRDSMGIFPFSLKKVCSSFCEKYKKIEYDISDLEHIEFFVDEYYNGDFKVYLRKNKNTEIVLRLKKYLSYDVLSLYEALNNFQKLTGLKRLNLTISRIGFAEINKTYDTKKLNSSYLYDNIFREAYFGGRTEVFKHYVDEEILYYYDVNSLYPYVMGKYEYPIGYAEKAIKYNEFGEKIESYNKSEHYPFFFAKISLNIPDNLYISPLAYRKNMKLYFPKGLITGWYNSSDISLLQFLGIPYRILDMIYFKESDFIFKDFVRKWYKIKKESKDNNSGMYTLSKLIMNSGYGVFGEKGDKKEIRQVSNNEIHKLMLEKINLNPILLNDKQGFIQFDLEQDKTFTLSHIASYITSNARKELFMIMHEILENGGKIYYCDTDSIITNIKLRTGEEIGELKLEDKIIDGVFALPKVYAYITYKNEKVIKCKGGYKRLKDSDEKRLTSEGVSYQDVLNLCKNKTDIQKDITRLSKQKSIIKGYKKNTEAYYLNWHIYANYKPKRMFFDDKNDSRMFNVNEI